MSIFIDTGVFVGYVNKKDFDGIVNRVAE